MPLRDIIESNLRSIQERITNAAHRVGREPDAVKLVAVTKYAELDWVRELVQLGQVDLGESRPQQLAQRAAFFRTNPVHSDYSNSHSIADNQWQQGRDLLSPDASAGLPAPKETVDQTRSTQALRWHLIGHLQRNKIDITLPDCDLIHSVDSIRLLEAIQKEALKQQRRAKILLEVNVSGESSKDGFRPNELLAVTTQLVGYDSIDIHGLMTMAPESSDPEAARPVFQSLFQLRNELTTRSDGRLNIPQLSMGMSGDFEIAIEEGATLVRIGSSLFEGCTMTLQG